MLQYTSIVINMAIQQIELKMGTTQNDAANMMTGFNKRYLKIFTQCYLQERNPWVSWIGL